MPDFSSYLESVRRHYEQWWSLYTLTNAEGRAQVKAKVFDFGLMVQTIAPQSQRRDEEPFDAKEPIDRFTVIDGLRKYAGEHVLLVGRPGSGKSTALARLLLEEEALTPSPSSKFGRGEQEKEIGRIPVLVELRYWNEDGVLGLIRSFLRSLPTQVGLTPVEIDRTTLEELLRSNRFLLLMDGLNELPSEVARQDVLRFRRDFPKVAIVFTTRDLSLGGDFGIEKKLEMQPLTESQMRSFVTAYIPEQSEAMLRQLGGRLWEFGSTPLLLWMLCGLFRQTGEIPANLGGVFRAFTTGYERSLKADVVLEGDRRWWAALLQEVAARMMIGDGSVEFRVAIDRAEVEAIFTEFLRDREAQAAGAATKALDDLLRHHLIQTNGAQVEFRHQLIQEYYAAEWLLGRVKGLDDATLQQDFLNYLKWTEPVALMLALVEDEAIAVRVVELALAVDPMSGASLAGNVTNRFQPPSLTLVLNSALPSGQKVPLWYRVEMLGQSKFPYAVSEIFSLLKHEDFSVRASAASALGCIKGDFSVNSLLEALNDPHRDVRRNSVVSLGKVGETRVIPFLLDALASDDEFMQEKALSSIQRLSNSNKNILPILLNNISSEYSFIRMSIAKIIGHSRNSVYLPKLLELSLDPSHEVRKSVAVALSNMEKTDEIIHTLKQLILDSDSGVCGQALIALANVCGEDAFDTITASFQRPEEFIRGSCAIASGSLSQLQALKLLTKNINDEHAYVRGSIASSLGKFPSWESAEGLLHYLKDPHEYVRGNASEGLSNFQDYFVGNSLVECCHDPHHYVRAKSVISLGTIGHLKAKSIILSMLSLDDHEYARGNAAISISYIYVDNEVIDALLSAICDISKHVYSHAAQALVDNANDFPEILGKLAAQLHLSPGKSIFRAVKGIQSSCKFYNYEIEQQAKLRKADRPSLEGGGGDRSTQIIVQGDYVAGDKIEGDNYTIDRVGNLNTGPVNIHGNQNGEQ